MIKYNLDNPMAPLWLMFPEIENLNLNSEKHKIYYNDFYNWFDSLNLLEKEKYKEMFPEPKRLKYNTNFENKNYCDKIILWNEEGRPHYKIDELKADFNKNKKIDFIFFWGHREAKNGEISKSCFSQWWKSDFKREDKIYSCMEQYMMYEKAKLFDDENTAKQIMESNNPKDIKSLGKKAKNFNQNLWDKYKYSIVLNGNYLKFIQNKSLMMFLFSTKNKILVEASPYDSIWGIKMSEKDDNIKNPLMWKGENLLGFALTEVREELKRICKNYDKINWEQLHNQYN